jgi:hypothetical protein
MAQSTTHAALEVKTLADLRGVARDDLLDAHERAWTWIAKPGSWLDGATRVAVVREIRQSDNCAFCRARKDALSPFAVEGEHDHLGALGAAEVEAIHRLATDSGRLSQAWIDGLIADGLSDGAYIEIAGIVAMTRMMDAFNWGAGAAIAEPPAAETGEPTGYRPPGARKDEAWVALVALEDVVDSDGDLYGVMAPGVHRALSLVPDSKRAFWELGEPHYIPMTELRNADTQVRAISRAQIEILASRTSALHQCVY